MTKPLLHRLAWPLTFLGLVVVLGAALVYMVEDSELERQWELALLDPARRAQAPDISLRRLKLRLWPGIVAGAVPMAIGLFLVYRRRRAEFDGSERAEQEGRFDDGRPIGFRRDDSE